MHQTQVSHTHPPEGVHLLEDKESGLEGVIVLHSTKLGPAAGGCRLWHYEDLALATHDAMRLAEGMAYKNAMAELPLGGGKAVIRKPEGAFDRRRLFQVFGREVAKLGGAYVTAEDVGTTVADMQAVRLGSEHVAGLEPMPGKPGGDPSPWTALGVYLSMQEAVRRKFGSDMRGIRVAVQGLGNVGSNLCDLLAKAGAELVVADSRSDVASAAADRFGAKLVSPQNVLGADCDVLAPCALGAALNRVSIPKLKAKVVCGGANNVLENETDGDALAAAGVLYCPDYVVNSGGIINVCAEYLGWSSEEVASRVNETDRRLAGVLDYAFEQDLAPHRAADSLARAKIAGAIRPKKVAA